MICKQTTVAIAISFVLALTCGVAEAKVVSINLDGEGLDQNELLAPGDVAGVVPVGNWNNVTGPFIYSGDTFLGTINDDSGAGTSITFASRGGSPNTTEAVSGSSANVKMMTGSGPRSQIDAPNSSNGGFNRFAQLQLGNLNAEFAGTYDVYLYIGTGWNCSVAGCFHGGWGDLIASTEGFQNNIPNPTDPGASVNNPGPAMPVTSGIITSVPYTTMVGSAAGIPGTLVYDETGAGFVETTAANPAAGGNYVKIEGLSADTLVLTLNPAFISGGNIEWNSNTMLGVQIVGNAVPEPSSFALAGLGLLGLVGYGLRLRSK